MALERQQNIQSIGLELGPLNVLQMLRLCIVATLQPIVKKAYPDKRDYKVRM